ncbi:MAG: LapA family protein [Woeseia sp.]|nr:LapA family protein [Woeseia sp.]NNL54228.1 LapA family protein [Woeseia sp.]
MRMKLVVTVILSLLAVVFILQNAAVVQIRFIIWEISMSRSLLVVLMVMIGALIGWFSHAIFRHAQKQMH